MNVAHPPLRIVRRVAATPSSDWPASVHPVLRRVYAARGIASPGELGHRLAGLLAPDGLGNIAHAVDLLVTALTGDARIVVAGDYDCDGATGCAVAVRGLR
ncbi:MAG TPA: single-stranded-DNA-specific exonuclease RecJ, partial [Rhodanobacteraceae bacterium]|nr:single-stranded-DNA-specific exonuclease RecJ [Rhodanobacteraceae bacterium]